MNIFIIKIKNKNAHRSGQNKGFIVARSENY